MSESRSSESRSSIGYSSSSESRGYSYSSESREESKPYIYSETKIETSDLENIDSLIESLEQSLPKTNLDSERVNKVYTKRKKQIEELKALAEEAKRKIEEDKQIEELNKENDSIEESINKLRRYLNK